MTLQQAERILAGATATADEWYAALAAVLGRRAPA